MQVYITDLEAYNNGHLVGRWYELPMSEDDLQNAINAVLKDGQVVCEDTHAHEEYFITDYECDYMKIGEFDSLYTLNAVAQMVSDLDEHQIKTIKVLMDAGIAQNVEDAIEKIDDIFCTGETSMEDIVYNYIHETGALQAMPENLQFYFDYEKLSRDMEIEGNYYTDNENMIWEYVG
jgi:antirestriction protein